MELRLKLGVEHFTSTIRRYMVRPRDPERGQRWRQFITNHGKEIYSCDFLTQYTALFAVVYIFVVMELASRRIVHLNVSESPGLDWVKQQIREAAPVGEEPKYLIHDNDGVFGQFGKRRHVEGRDGMSEKAYRCHLDWRLETVMGIKGVAIPYGAPNANSRLERFHRTLRQEALNHCIFFNEGHVRRVCSRYIEYYNHARPSQAHNRIPAPYPKLCAPPPKNGEVIAIPILGGIHHDYRRAL